MYEPICVTVKDVNKIFEEASGTYNNETGLGYLRIKDACHSCPAGSFSTGLRSTACEPCPTGYAKPHTGTWQSVCEECQSCGKGTERERKKKGGKRQAR